MAQQRAQALITEDDLANVVAEILNRVPPGDSHQQLVAAAMLGRVGGARSRAILMLLETKPALAVE